MVGGVENAMTPRRTPIGPAVVLLLALVGGGWFLQQGMAQQQNIYVQNRLFEEVIDYIAERYVDEVDRATLYEQAIEGVIRGLNDPNTSLLDGAAYENFQIQTEGNYGGVGLEITERDEYITVISPLPGGPGTQAGIRLVGFHVVNKRPHRAGGQIGVFKGIRQVRHPGLGIRVPRRGRPGALDTAAALRHSLFGKGIVGQPKPIRNIGQRVGIPFTLPDHTLQVRVQVEIEFCFGYRFPMLEIGPDRI